MGVPSQLILFSTHIPIPSLAYFYSHSLFLYCLGIRALHDGILHKLTQLPLLELDEFVYVAVSTQVLNRINNIKLSVGISN